MTKIKSPPGFVSTPKTAPKSATTEGKPAGAPELKKAPKRAGDSFEQTKPAPKSGKEGFKVNDRVIVKVIADEPTTPVKGENTGLKVNDRIIVKIVADEPTNPVTGGGDIGFKGNIGGKGDFKDIGFPHGPIKVIADEPTTPVTGGGTPGLIDDHIVKIVADEPTNPVTGGGTSGLIDDHIVKIVADEPTNPIKGGTDSGLKIGDHIVKVIADEPTNPIKGGGDGSIKDIDDGVIVKIISDDPIRGPSEPSFKPPKLDIKPLDTQVLKVRMDSPV
ncbi:hypothetical protein D7Y13_06195 [Corallococcus praedator]|uniref:Collagen-like protein n=1 Tax=Corallococcus praedator TaxID=2316724 RepID=A0ABX9QQ36_9BACT|nr:MULTISPECIES: hypothetical protein [Corallococcus]RKH18835.1 hypothetical protein D7X74_08525 [Corallococcus sp. CA047B]RKH33940.1 hypothetical protein D7X75_10115 [Corallococcus sp. CA031C]RKI14312.1 hypothetical protein D7Y13_06195 [Corallococcus praedator]